MPLHTIIENAISERARLQRALRPYDGTTPFGPSERQQLAYELTRFSRRMKRLTAELEWAA